MTIWQRTWANRRRISAALALVVLLFAHHVPQVWGQNTEWVETEVAGFTVLTSADDVGVAGHVGDRADALYGGLAAAFGAEIPRPIGLRVHPSVDSYLRSNPLVVESDGVLSGTRKRRRELEVVLPLAEAAGADGVDNALRREMARLLAATLSEQEVSEGLLQGVALYLEMPDESMAAGVARLRDAHSRGSLMGPSGLVTSGALYTDPATRQAESRAFVQFVVDTRGFGALTTWLSTMRSSSGWRQAMEAGLGSPPEDLGASFDVWLPSYLDGGWRDHALYSGNLSTLEKMVQDADYVSAMAHLQAVEALTKDAQPDVAQRADALLQRAASGIVAGEQIELALAAFEEGNYAVAETAGRAARDAYLGLGDADGASVSEELMRRSRLGLDAHVSLQRSAELSPLRVMEARLAAAEAAASFEVIGNDTYRSNAMAQVAAHDRRLLPTAWLLVALGIGVLVWNARKRMLDRQDQTVHES